MFSLLKPTKKPTDSELSIRQSIFVRIYADLYTAWLETGDIELCTVEIDVSNLSEPVDEWVKAINNNFHIYKGTLFKIHASKIISQSFFEDKELLKVDLLEFPEIITGSINA